MGNKSPVTNDYTDCKFSHSKSFLHLSVSQIKDPGSEDHDKQTPAEQAGHKSQEESDTGESDEGYIEGENEEDENKATKEELYLLLISFFAILGLTHCAMA